MLAVRDEGRNIKAADLVTSLSSPEPPSHFGPHSPNSQLSVPASLSLGTVSLPGISCAGQGGGLEMLSD